MDMEFLSAVWIVHIPICYDQDLNDVFCAVPLYHSLFQDITGRLVRLWFAARKLLRCSGNVAVTCEWLRAAPLRIRTAYATAPQNSHDCQLD
ncbi:hypothetical protein RB195_000407 [Necator americanus]|uniref:Uncharacterized protein n=1 Tax=Necator americanus TaxID=51031 RepID=A0ABR1D9K3_NECAM